MSYTTADARGQLLASVAQATDELAAALAALGEAYEQVDDRMADALEEQLFRPVQLAYGRAQRAHDDFAARTGLPVGTFSAGSAGSRSQGARALIERAGAMVDSANQTLATLQDSMLPVEVGDAELRAALADVRERIAQLPQRGRDLIRLLGR